MPGENYFIKAENPVKYGPFGFTAINEFENRCV